MRLALVGDLHLDDRSPRFQHTLDVLDWTISDALEAGATGVAFLGDLCEGRPSPRVVAALARRFRTIKERGGWTVIVEGNHEDYEAGLIAEWLDVRRVAWNEFQTIHDDASILLVPYPRRGRPPFHDLEDDGTIAGNMGVAAERIREEIAEELKAIAEVSPGMPLIVLGHFTIEGMTTRDAEFELHQANEVVVPKSAFHHCALVAVGHIHKAQDVDLGLIGVGGLIRHSFSEANDPKSYTLVTVDGGCVSWERRPVPAREMVVTTLRWDADLRAVIAKADPLFFGLSMVGKEVKLTVEIPEDQLATFDPTVFDPIREAAAHFVLDKVSIPTERTRAPEIATADSLEAQLDTWLVATQQDVTEERRGRLHAKVAGMRG